MSTEIKSFSDIIPEDYRFINPIAITVFVILMLIVIALIAMGHPIIGFSGIPVAVLIASFIRIANQWDKAVILRLGKFRGLKGPGLFFIIPIVDRIPTYIDQRIRVTDFAAEKTLTKDTVPVNVDAVVYWLVWDVEKAALEVRKYKDAVYFIAQTGLRDIIGKHELADLLQNRDKIAEDLQLRGMNMLFEGLKEKGSLVIVPSSALESMNLGAIGGLTALGKSEVEMAL